MIDELFKKAKNNDICNTSYPLNKKTWLKYRKENYDLFKNEKKLSIYIHIPFCKNICSFCEYVKYNKNINYEKVYLEILKNDINKFFKTHKIDLLYGFDIGGGTPTSLDIDNFKTLMKIAKKINTKYQYVKDYEPSIEATFSTITEEKIKLIKDAGFKRISLGIQTINTKILLNNNREIIKLDILSEKVNLIKKYNLKVNLDLMYGLPHQNKEDIINSIKIIEILNPNQVTLYEMRYNMIKSKCSFTKNQLFIFYNTFYNHFTKMGYKSTFGQNTFSKENDLGLSSYLKYRMIDNISYKGFGISAQSKSKIGLSYNIGKNKISFEDTIKYNSFIEEDIYVLPKEELLSKYIAVSMYYGKFKLSIMNQIMQESSLDIFKEEFKYLKEHNFITIKDDIVSLTNTGFKYYGAVGSLFYSNDTKKLIIGDKND